MWLQENWGARFSEYAMWYAVTNNHLNIIIWLHDNGRGCTTAAMDGGANCSHLEIVKRLHENCSKGCTTAVMDAAAKNDHLNVV